MEPQPQEDSSVHFKEQIADLKADLAQIKELLQRLARHIDDKPSLTNQANLDYYLQPTLNNQEQNLREEESIYSSNAKPLGKPSQIPFVAEGQRATCARCKHTWFPFVRRPKKCPSCRQPWYKPKAWVRNKHLVG